MKKTTLEQVKKLAAQLSPDDRLQVCQFLADFPDSGISYDQDLPAELFVVPPSVPLKLEHKKRALGMLELKTEWDCVTENGQVVYSLEGREVFRAIFNHDNYVEVCFEKLRADALSLTVKDDARVLLRESLRKFLTMKDTKPTEELLDTVEVEALQALGEKVLRRSILTVSSLIANNLDKAVPLVLSKIVGLSSFAVANEIRDSLAVPETKISAADIKSVIYAPDWEHLKTVVGITHGGSSPRVLVDDAQCVTLSTDYPVLLKHWKNIAQMRRRKQQNWRGHAKLDVEDTPDDLLDRLNDDLPQEESGDYPNIPSALAHEHAARHAGIPNNEYGLSQLGRFRRRGDQLRGQ